jgi:hypothetical protein
VLGTMMRTVSSFEFVDGFYLSTDSHLSDTIMEFNERRLGWYHDPYNWVMVRYELDIELLTCICIVSEQWVFFESTDVEMSEWNGTDEKWHNLAIEIVDDQMTIYRDYEIVFEHSDPLIAYMPRTGQIEVSNKSSRTCFDNVLLESIDVIDYVCGDADANLTVDIDDVVYALAYIFTGGPPPVPTESADVTCDGGLDIDDVVYLIAYIFTGGPAPCDASGDGEPDC